MLVCDGQCVGKVCGVKVKSDTSYCGRSVLLASCFKHQVSAMQISLFLIVLLIYRRAPRQQPPGSVLLYYHSQQQLSMEKYMSRSQCQQKSLNQKEGGKKKKSPSSSGTFSASFMIKSGVHQAAGMEPLCCPSGHPARSCPGQESSSIDPDPFSLLSFCFAGLQWGCSHSSSDSLRETPHLLMWHLDEGRRRRGLI